MKIASFKKIITCQIGDELGGYGNGIVSVAIHDDLYLKGLCMDDGNKKVLMLSYDLVGIDMPDLKHIRDIVKEELGLPPEDVVISCTHNHSGPHSRWERTTPLNERYMKELFQWTREAVCELKEAQFREVAVYFYGKHCKENINRRVVALEDNTAKALPSFKELMPFADGITDDEVGVIAFYDETKPGFTDVLVNFAAHPLASHCPLQMKAGNTITADFPGELRKYVEENTGADCIYVTGAAGDMFPKEFEQGFDAARKMGINLAKAVVESMANMRRNRERFAIKEPVLNTKMVDVTLHLRCNEEKKTSYAIRKDGMESCPEGLHFLTIGKDVCFVGVPGELLAEVGLMMKWCSPFRKTFILYNSTDYVGYLCHPNVYVSKGFEYNGALFHSLTGFKLLQSAVKNMYELRGDEFGQELPELED